MDNESAISHIGMDVQIAPHIVQLMYCHKLVHSFHVGVSRIHSAQAKRILRR